MNGKLNKAMSKVKGDLSSGLLYTHTRINDNTKKILESTSFLYALIELLNENGIISIEELDERKKLVAERLVKKFKESGMGLMYQDPEHDKYSFTHTACVDCSSRMEICKAICCKLPFALSKQDVDEGIIKWNFSRPYIIAHDSDGYCVHLDRETYKCTAHEHRPVPCRGFDCKDNERWKVWSDYDKKVLNSELGEKIKQTNGKV
ncbi:MAG: YkgJ family cysteine cluster protein [Deltaproteobacteria bacterium]|nr:YkgJ family cysteine cluster protein [Deltaproteobacteria bacterium]MCP5007156.1 YkgJ family cysteine cluster protein [Planctomycetota bacterium]